MAFNPINSHSFPLNPAHLLVPITSLDHTGLSALPRYHAVIADLEDLGFTVPEQPTPVFPATSYEALGWLYCSEGSNLGAAFLFKETQKIGLNGEHGARHLAPHPDGRAPQWREFVAILNNLPLTQSQADAAVQGARHAFDFYRAALKEIFA